MPQRWSLVGDKSAHTRALRTRRDHRNRLRARRVHRPMRTPRSRGRGAVTGISRSRHLRHAGCRAHPGVADRLGDPGRRRLLSRHALGGSRRGTGFLGAFRGGSTGGSSPSAAFRPSISRSSARSSASRARPATVRAALCRCQGDTSPVITPASVAGHNPGHGPKSLPGWPFGGFGDFPGHAP